MPSCKTKKWGNIKLTLLPRENDLIRNILRWTPYFWDNEIYFDLLSVFPSKKGFNLINTIESMNEVWIYDWELCGLDKKIREKGQGTLDLNSKKAKVGTIRKPDAIKIEDVPIGKYRMYITFSNDKGERSERMFITSFTVKDKEEYFSTYLLPAIIALVVSLIVSIFT